MEQERNDTVCVEGTFIALHAHNSVQVLCLASGHAKCAWFIFIIFRFDAKMLNSALARDT